MVNRNHLNGKDDSGYWGVLNRRNIRQVVLGNYQFDTWYGNGAYFNRSDTTCLGYEFSNRTQNSRGRKSTPLEEEYWLDTLHVCEYCFKYTAKASEMKRHRNTCEFKLDKPTVGKLVYYDKSTIIRQVRGFHYPLFCQNLALFGKLFLDDKSVYYNLDHYDFYVVYKRNDGTTEGGSIITNNYLPMGFFSKEVVSWDNNNNLACICVFPPYQRKHLGWFLIEFLYALAQKTPGQVISGPEFPLSPYGKISYYRFWSVKLAHVIGKMKQKSFTLQELSAITGFRNEDILLTLEYMQLLSKDYDQVKLMLGNLAPFCEKNHIDPNDPRDFLNKEYLLI